MSRAGWARRAPPGQGDRKGDAVDHPTHYTSHGSGVECIELTEAMPFCLGNAIKYLFRCGLKGDALEDMQKSAWYLRREAVRLRRIEEFRPVEGTSLHVSSLGRVRGPKGIRKPVVGKNGYEMVVSRVDGRATGFYVHRLVAAAFLGPSDLWVAHGDGNRRNNAVWNLRYATAAENSADRVIHKTTNAADRNGCARLTWEQVKQARADHAAGIRAVDIAKRLHVARATVQRLLSTAWNEEAVQPTAVQRFLASEPASSVLRQVLQIVQVKGGSCADALDRAAVVVENAIDLVLNA